MPSAKLGALEDELTRLELQRVEIEARVETSDDLWDETMVAFQQTLLELARSNLDHPLYRKYFAEIPSQVTSLSHAAEILVSKDLEQMLEGEEVEALRQAGESGAQNEDALHIAE